VSSANDTVSRCAAPSSGPRPERIEAEIRDDPGEEGRWLGHAGTVRSLPAQPGILQDVLGVGDGPEHPIRDAEQARALRLELVEAV
jgi:hypothetical protein